MNEVINLLQEESNLLVSEISKVDVHLQDVLDMMTLLKNSCSSDENKSMHCMLDVVITKLKNIKHDEVTGVVNRLDNFYICLAGLQETPKRTRTVKKDAVKETNKPANRKPRPKKNVEQAKETEKPKDDKLEQVVTE